MPNEYTINEADLIGVADAIREKGETTEQLEWPEGYKAAIKAISGAGLNFEVVGGTVQPENPVENTIWVNTDTEITRWEIGGDDPGIAVTELYENITLKKGYYLASNGAETSYSTWNCTPHIALPENTSTIVVSVGSSTSSGVYHIFYNSSGTLISYVTRATGVTTYAVPSGAATVRLSIRVDDYGPSVTATHKIPGDDGFVWIAAKTGGPGKFNAIKDDNGVFIKVESARQFIGGEWVKKKIQLYQESVWKDNVISIISRGTLMYDGTIGRTSTYGSHYSSAGKYVVITNTNDNYAIYLGPIDLTDRDAIVIDINAGISWVGTYVPAIAVCSSAPSYSTSDGITSCVAFKKLASSTAVVFSGVYSLPINLSGKYYIAISVGGSGYISNVTGNNNGYVRINDLYIE